MSEAHGESETSFNYKDWMMMNLREEKAQNCTTVTAPGIALSITKPNSQTASISLNEFISLDFIRFIDKTFNPNEFTYIQKSIRHMCGFCDVLI